MRTDRQLPQAPRETEEAVLTSCILFPDHRQLLLERLRPEDFYRGDHQTVFRAVRDMAAAGQPVEVPSLVERLRKNGKLEEISWGTRISKILDAGSVIDPPHYARLLRDKAAKRRLVELGQRLMDAGFKDDRSAGEILDEAQTAVLGLDNDRGADRTASLGDLISDASDRYERLQNSPGAVTGIPTGFADLDFLLCGLQPSDLIILAARPSMGKTALALNIARNAAGAGFPVAFFSLEMSDAQLTDRFISAEGRVNSLKLRSGKFKSDDWPKIVAAQGRLHGLPIIIDDTQALGINDFRSRARRMAQKHRVRLIIVDYLQLMVGDGKNGRVEEVGSISRGLKATAKELDLPVLALSQLSRACESRPDRRPLLSDLRDSGSIEQDADVVACLYRDEIYNTDIANPNRGKAEVLIRKHRNGPVADVALSFHAPTMQFSNFCNEGEWNAEIDQKTNAASG